MKKRLIYLVIFFILFSMLYIFFPKPKEYIECFNPIVDEVELVAEFASIKDIEDNSKGIGVISFKIDDYLYGIGHNAKFNNTKKLSAYKILPNFTYSYKDNIGEVTIGSELNEKMGTIISKDGNGIIVKSELLDNKSYSKIKVADKIFSGDAELLIRDETGKINYYSINIKINEKFKSTCFDITITDKKLLDKIGGILQGMSGTPIIQNGKLVGILTGVYVRRPWCGKGKIIWDYDCIKIKK
ncbi:MAG: hypothetical protein E7311_00250 [Clostridiales bacterium]|nr:hypothetical protein [Clostridiales bacterium]